MLGNARLLYLASRFFPASHFFLPRFFPALYFFLPRLFPAMAWISSTIISHCS